MAYCASRFHSVRRPTLAVNVGSVGVGGAHPLRLQSMTTSDTQDVAATVQQSIALAEVGCEIVRITAPNTAAARCLRAIRAQLNAAGFAHLPLVADIHFLPSAAMEAVEHVEKIRINPGNYADKKKFAVREYSDADYDNELVRLHDAFSPLVQRCRTLGRALRIGTNHGSLSDRIMNRYGDTPLGMVESALEFLRIAEAHSYRAIILSMKSSNPKVMIQAYRLLVDRMAKENMHYPLHLGVTEAGDGEDGRIKSAIGIGSLLLDGLGDTLRVSLTEDSVYEIPVARAIADKAMSLWRSQPPAASAVNPSAPLIVPEGIDPYLFKRRLIRPGQLTPEIKIGPDQPPRVIVKVGTPEQLAAAKLQLTSPKFNDTPAEGLLVSVDSARSLEKLPPPGAAFYVVELPAGFTAANAAAANVHLYPGTLLLKKFSVDEADELQALVEFARARRAFIAAEILPTDLSAMAATLHQLGEGGLIFTLAATPPTAAHSIGGYRQLAATLRQLGSNAPIWIRNTATTAVQSENNFLSKLLESAFLAGGLLCDGLGDFLSIETETDPARATKLTYNVLQGAGVRSSKTEFVACPSCGRTLFDLQTTTQRIRAQTGHLKGVKIAIMGCIVNGPGEMADADFGYVGGAPGKINLYVGKNCVQYNLPQDEADARLVALIKAHGKWIEPSVT